MSVPRKTRDGPFAWQSKDGLRRIADSCDGRTDRAFVISVYVTLTWIASDRQTEQFQESIGRIAERAGMSYRKAADILDLLVRLELLAVTGNLIDGTKERAPSTYTLRTLCLTSGTECLRLGTETFPSVPRIVEESLEESEKNIAPTGEGRVSTASKTSPKAKKSSERNPILDALAILDGGDLNQVTRSAWGASGKALAEIREVSPDVTADEIRRRATNYRDHFRDATLTASALAKHWARCDVNKNDGGTNAINYERNPLYK